MISFRSTITKLNKRLPLKLAAALLAGSTLVGSLLGLFKDRLFNSAYLETYELGADAFTIAFSIPDFMFFILVSGALSVSFIPVFNERLAKGNKKSAWELSTSLINLMAIATLIASILIIIFAEPLVKFVVGPGLNESGTALAVSMMRVIAVNPFLFAVATVVASMQQAVGRFAFFALSPVLYNLGIIIGILYFTQGITIFGWEIFEGGIMGVALGVVLGAMMQLIVSTLGLFGLGFDYRFKIYWKNQGFRRVLRLLPPRSLDQSMDYVNTIVEMNLASRMAAGTARAYQQVSAISFVPVNLIGVAISTAAFPQMTERLGQGRPDLFKKELQTVLRVIIWLALPVTIITFFARGYVIDFLVVGGSAYMASILSVLAFTILFRSIYFIAARSFYAQQDTKTPLFISFFTIALNITLAVVLTQVYDMGVQGLAWAAVITSFVEVAILFTIMQQRIKGMFDAVFIGAAIRMVVATGLMGIITYIMVSLLPLSATDQSFYDSFPKFTIIVLVSLVFYVLFSYFFKLQEVKPIISRIQKILFKSPKTHHDTTPRT